MLRIVDARLIARWARLWKARGLARVRVEWSDRLTRALGRAYPARGLVRLSSALRRRPALARAALCHELAHVAAWERGEPAHGPTWAALVRAAGYEPVLRVTLAKPRPSRPPATTARWIHRCPVCQFRRTAKRPVRAWRCARCVEAGLAGDLLITRRAA